METVEADPTSFGDVLDGLIITGSKITVLNTRYIAVAPRYNYRVLWH